MQANDELVRRATVENIVRVYVESEREIREACATIAAACGRLDHVFVTGEGREGRGFSFCGHRRDAVCFENPKDEVEELRRQVWSHLVEKLELRRMLSIERAKELDKWLAGTPEDITIESVFGLFRHYVEKLPEMLAEAVREVYSFLRPCRSEYKTNTEYELGERVILSGWVEGNFSGGFRQNYYFGDRYRALENVFTALDGKGQTGKGWRTELANAIEKSGSEGTGRTEYFAFRACKNRNLHLQFLRPDLVLRFNQIAGGKNLTPAPEHRKPKAHARRARPSSVEVSS